MPMFMADAFIRTGTHERLAHDEAFGPADAGQRAELRVAAFDQLPEQRRVQARRRRRRSPAAGTGWRGSRAPARFCS